MRAQAAFCAPVEFGAASRPRKAANSRPAGEGAGVLDRGPDRVDAVTRLDAGNGHQPLGRLVRLDRRRSSLSISSDGALSRRNSIWPTSERSAPRTQSGTTISPFSRLKPSTTSHALQAIGVVRALRRDEAGILGQMAAQSIEAPPCGGRRATPARPMAHQLGLVVDRTHRHEPLARTTPSPRRSPLRQLGRFCCGRT